MTSSSKPPPRRCFAPSSLLVADAAFTPSRLVLAVGMHPDNSRTKAPKAQAAIDPLDNPAIDDGRRVKVSISRETMPLGREGKVRTRGRNVGAAPIFHTAFGFGLLRNAHA